MVVFKRKAKVTRVDGFFNWGFFFHRLRWGGGRGSNRTGGKAQKSARLPQDAPYLLLLHFHFYSFLFYFSKRHIYPEVREGDIIKFNCWFMGFLEGTDREKDRIVGGRKKRAALEAIGRPRRRWSLPIFSSAVVEKNLWTENNLLPV